MKLDFPPRSSRRGPRPRAPHVGIGASSRSGVRLERALLSGALLALLLACGGSSDREPLEPPGCSSEGECADGEQCIDSACVVPSPAPGMSAGMSACNVVRCPPSEPGCCVAATATATGNESQGYASRNQMVSGAGSPRDVRATFSFDAAGQQGWLSFDLGSELDLDRLDFTGFHDGAADRFLTVNTNLDSDSGCAFGFDLEPRPSASGAPSGLGDASISFANDNFCYGGASPGRARQVAFAIFSLRAGEATLSISNITLHE